jgi:hypothetical protein
MKIVKEENGLRLSPDNEWERECLEKIANKTLTAKWEDGWDQRGDLVLRYEAHPWDKQ